MAERVVNLSDWEARAWLAGATQLRRPVAFDAESFAEPYICYSDKGHSGPGAYVTESEYEEEGSMFVRSPYAVGDVLLGRETWLVRGQGKSVIYRADYSGVDAAGIAGMYSDRGWRSSATMPRWAVRQRRRVTGVCVERIQDTTNHDACAMNPTIHCQEHAPMKMCRDQFAALWDARHGARHPWASNPWTFVYSLEVAT